MIFFLTLYQEPKRTSLPTFPQQEEGGGKKNPKPTHFTLSPTDFIHVPNIDRTVLRMFLLILL